LLSCKNCVVICLRSHRVGSKQSADRACESGRGHVCDGVHRCANAEHPAPSQHQRSP
jgi:hypothetical protein